MVHSPGGDDCILVGGSSKLKFRELREFWCFLGLAHLRVGWHLATFTCSVYHRPGAGVFAVGVADFSCVPPNLVKIGGLGTQKKSKPPGPKPPIDIN